MQYSGVLLDSSILEQFSGAVLLVCSVLERSVCVWRPVTVPYDIFLHCFLVFALFQSKRTLCVGARCKQHTPLLECASLHCTVLNVLYHMISFCTAFSVCTVLEQAQSVFGGRVQPGQHRDGAVYIYTLLHTYLLACSSSSSSWRTIILEE